MWGRGKESLSSTGLCQAAGDTGAAQAIAERL